MATKKITVVQPTGRPRRQRVITKIEAAPRVKPKLKVAAYCRVSTARDGQLTSIENQRIHYEQMIAEKEEWELVDIYYEEGVSGTKKEIRPELKRMLADCRRGRIDLILTKSISRFARNTSDCLEMVRELTGLGVNIYFEKENIHTGSMESEFLLTILASLAEEESHNISGNEKWAIQRRLEAGKFHVSKVPYGYRLENKQIVLVEAEAEIVRSIFSKVLEGKGTSMIARELNEKGIPTGTTKRDGTPGEWTASRIQNMINNISYTGDMIFQKTFHDGERQRMNNYGDRPQYYVEDHHEAIIEKETFEKVQENNRQRGREKNNNPPADKRGRNSKYQNRYCMSGIVYCGNCGSVMKRQMTSLKSGKRYHWLCKQHLKDVTSCGQKKVLEEDIQNMFMSMLNRLYFAQGLILDNYIEEVHLMERQKHLEQEVALQNRLQENIDTRHRLMQLLTKECIEPILHKQKMIELEIEAAQIREELSELKDSEYLTEGARAFRRFVNQWGVEGEQIPVGAKRLFPEEAFAEHVEKVVVYARLRFAFHLKCGLVFAESLLEGEEGN